MSEIQKGLETSTSTQKETLSVKFEGKNINLSGDNKLTKEELKTIESLFNGDKEKILEQTKGNLKELKNILVTDLKNRLDRGKNGYISNLLSRTEKFLDSKISTDEVKTETGQTQITETTDGANTTQTEVPVQNQETNTGDNGNTEQAQDTTNTQNGENNSGVQATPGETITKKS